MHNVGTRTDVVLKAVHDMDILRIQRDDHLVRVLLFQNPFKLGIVAQILAQGALARIADIAIHRKARP